MALRRPSDKPLSGPVMVRFFTYICVTRPQWVKHGTHVKAIYEVIHIHVHVIKCGYHQYMIHRSSMSCSWNANRINIIQWFDDNDYAYIQLPVFNHSPFLLQRQYYWPLTCWFIFNIIQDPFTFHVISWILFHRRRPNSQWSKSNCYLYSTVNTISAEALVT